MTAVLKMMMMINKISPFVVTKIYNLNFYARIRTFVYYHIEVYNYLKFEQYRKRNY